MFNQSSRLRVIFFLVILSGLGVFIIKPLNLVSAQNSPDAQKKALLKELKESPDPVPMSDLVVYDSMGEYTILAPGQKINGRLGIPAAQLVDLPAELAQEVAFWVAPKNAEPVAEDAIAYEFISSLRYRGNGHTIYVTRTRLTSAAGQLKHQLGKPGNAGGMQVGISSVCDGSASSQTEGLSCVDSPTPNQVAFMKGNQIITVASDLPVEQVKSLISKVKL
jgi:hypothetical protein